jgi:uncharacterized protein YggU (UPF0235/DUF167 family)
MEIPEKTLNRWKALRSESDTEKIVEMCREKGIIYTAHTIRAVFRQGKANDELFKAIGEYYKQKQEMINQFA